MIGCERDREMLAQEVPAFESRWLLARLRGVLEGQREMQLAGSDARRQVVGSLVDGDLGVGMLHAEAFDRSGDDPGECGGERADTQTGAVASRGGGEL
jgi:hypothetical protein